MPPIIETRDLRKVFRSLVRRPGMAGTLRTLFSRDYEDKIAVEGITMALDEGELVGYIGPNGAGKSTTIKMLTGILVPTSGTVRVAGLVPHEQRQRNARNIGVVFGQRSQLYWDLPLVESFELLRAIYGIPAQRYRANLDHFTDVLDMGPFLRTPVRQLSLGQRMRGDFAAAMLHDPHVVFLDEPTIGLDVVAKEAIREFVARVNRERGTTFILTTHDLADVERLCRHRPDRQGDAGLRRRDRRAARPLRHAPHAGRHAVRSRSGRARGGGRRGGRVARGRRLAAALRPPQGLGRDDHPPRGRPLLRERPDDRGARARVDHPAHLPRRLQRRAGLTRGASLYGTRVISCG
jgi:ABC-type multidrug transport system ATPase subunit